MAKEMATNVFQIMVGFQRTVFNFTPKGELWPPGANFDPPGANFDPPGANFDTQVKLSPRGEDPTSATPFFRTVGKCSPLRVNEGVNYI
jgi:hypothetical protein